MASEILSNNPFGAESLEQAKALIEQCQEELPRAMGTEGHIVTDKQTERILRVLRILTQQIEHLRNATDNNHGIH